MTFRHDEPGTPEGVWRSWRGAPTRPLHLPLNAPTGARHLVVLAAHPDDETLGAGGLIARAAAAGARVDVVVATAGEASHPRSPTTTADALARCRDAEVLAAVAALAPRARLHRLGLPDGRVAEHAAAVARALRCLVGSGTVVAAPWRGDGHPDHDAAGAAARLVASQREARLLEYPLWAWHWAVPGDERLPWANAVVLALDGPSRQRKAAAMAAHRSQVEPLSALPGDEALLGPHVLAHFTRDTETFFADVPGVASAPQRRCGVLDGVGR